MNTETKVKIKVPTPMGAIRAKCVWCCDGSTYETKNCTAEICPLWAFRAGHKPKNGETRPPASKLIRAKCLDCVGKDRTRVRECTDKECPLYRFRLGRGFSTRSQKGLSEEHKAKLAAGRERANAVKLDLFS